MKCLKCGFEIDPNELFCPKCFTPNEKKEINNLSNDSLVNSSEIINNTQNEQIHVETLNQTINNNEYLASAQKKPIDRQKMINAYIHHKSKILKGNFSFATLFFSELYYFYKKMYIRGIFLFIYFIILLSIYYGIIAVLNTEIFLKFPMLKLLLALITIIALIYLWIKRCKKFQEDYNYHVTEKVNKIITANINKSEDEIETICYQKGGNNTALPIFILILRIFLIYISIYVIANYNQLADQYLKYISTNGKIINYSLSNNFSEENRKEVNNRKSLKDEYYLHYVIDTNNFTINRCEVSISSSLDISPFSNLPKKAIKNILSEHGMKTYGISTKNINNTLWYYVSYQVTTNGQSYRGLALNDYYKIYVTSKHNVLYLITFVNENNTEECSQDEIDFMNSITFKKVG